jgi:hypothetical protein
MFAIAVAFITSITGLLIAEALEALKRKLDRRSEGRA